MGKVWVMGKQPQNVVYNTDFLEKLQVENTNEIDYCTILLLRSVLPGLDPNMVGNLGNDIVWVLYC